MIQMRSMLYTLFFFFYCCTYHLAEASDFAEIFKKITCKILQGDVKLNPGNGNGNEVEFNWFCELERVKSSVVSKNGNGKQPNAHETLKNPNYRLENIPSSFILEHIDVLSSGEAWVDITNVWKEPDHPVLILEHNSNIRFNEEKMKISRRSRRRQFSKTMGEKSMLLVKVVASGLNFLSLSEEDIIDGVFGPEEGSMNSQFKACSHNQISFIPATGPGVNAQGLLRITIPRTLFGRDLIKIYNLVSEATKDQLGGLDKYDHVAYFLAFGTYYGSVFNMNWSGFSFLNGKMSIYNHLSGRYLSPLMHEVGHNLGLHHSTEGEDEFGDTTGYMGESFPRNDDPLMCFNAAHSWELGWYDDRNVEILPVSDTLHWSGQLFGVNDYNSTAVANLEDYAIVLKIVTAESDEDFYVMYNSKKGITRDVQEYGNKTVVVGSKGKSTTIRKVLSEQSKFHISNFNNTNFDVILRICEQKTDSVSALVYSLSSLTGDWYDGRGTEFNCDWYNQGIGERCASDGTNNRNFGMVAMEVCCICIDEYTDASNTKDRRLEEKTVPKSRSTSTVTSDSIAAANSMLRERQ